MITALLLIAHGTRSDDGLQTVLSLADAVRAARPGLDVRLCFLDVREPSLPAALADLPGPAVAVPVLLSTGYHVRVDIPGAVTGRPDVLVAPHLGPDPALTRTLADRLGNALGTDAPSPAIALVATGSGDPAAADDLRAAADQLASTLGRPVHPLALGDGDLATRLDALGPVDVVPYLLAEGVFARQIRDAAAGRVVADVIGVHPEVVALVLARYDALCTSSVEDVR